MPPRAKRSRAVPISHFRTECETARLTLISLDASTKEAIERWKPGSEENQGKDAYCWLAYYRRLHREIAARQRSESTPALGTLAEDSLVAAALANEPKHVRRLLPDVGGDHRYLLVYPKSYSALLHLMRRDACLGFLAREVARIGVVGSPSDLDAHVRALEEIDYQQRVCAWIVTTPGVGLPFGWHEDSPQPPEWTRDLETTELVSLIAAHQEVNRERLAYLRALIDDDHDAPSAEPRRPSWSVFFGALASEQHARPEDLMRDRSLAELLAQVRLASSAKQEAVKRMRDEAERDAERKRSAA